MILVPLIHIQRAVYMGVHKQRIVSQRAAYAQIVAHSVALDIGFVYDVEAIPVAQLIETFLLRVVAGADGVYVVLLPKLEVFQHELFGNVMPGVFIMLVIVDAFHEDRSAVYHQLLVLYLYGTETDFAAGGLDNIAVDMLQADNERVEVGRLGCPLQRCFDCLGGELHFRLTVTHTGRGLGNLPVFAVQQAIAYDERDFLVGFVGELHFQFQDSVAIISVQRRFGLEVRQMYLRAGIYVNVPFDAADAPKVLTLQIVAVGKAVYLYGYHVFAPVGKRRNVEAGRGLGVFVHADKLAVEVVERRSAHSVGAQEDFFALPIGRQGEGAAVGSRGIPFLGHVRRIGLIPVRSVAGRAEFVRVVDVDGSAETLHFPVAGDVDVRPAAYVCPGIHEVGGAVGEVLYVIELPLSVEGDAECSVLAVVDDGVRLVRIRGKGTAGRFFVDVRQSGIGDLRVPVFLRREGERKKGGGYQ